MPPPSSDHRGGPGSGFLIRIISIDPLGDLELVASASGLCGLSFRTWGDRWKGPSAPAPTPTQAHEEVLDQAEAFLRAALAPQAAGVLPPAPRLDLRQVSAFTRQVLDATLLIPRGSTWSYGQIACHLGKPGGARAVGQALGRNPLPILIPCHRVVGHAGLGGFTPGVVIKRRLLAIEGQTLSPCA